MTQSAEQKRAEINKLNKSQRAKLRNMWCGHIEKVIVETQGWLTYVRFSTDQLSYHVKLGPRGRVFCRDIFERRV